MEIKNDEGFVADKSLRNIACRKIANVLEKNNFDKSNAREIAVCIEAKIRNLDPRMGKNYRSCFRKMIKDIKLLNFAAYNEIKVHLV